MDHMPLTMRGSWFLLGRRTAAYVIDIVLLFAILAPLSFGVQRLFRITPASGPAIWLTAILSFSLPSWLYFILSDAGRQGATLGKRLWRVHVTDVHGRRLTLLRALGRTAVKLIPWEMGHLVFVVMSDEATWNSAQTALLVVASGLLVLYYVTAIVTRGRQSMHDLAVSTLVQIQEENT